MSGKYLFTIALSCFLFNSRPGQSQDLKKLYEIQGEVKNQYTGTSFAANNNQSIIALGYSFVNKNLGYVEVYQLKNHHYELVGEIPIPENCFNIGHEVTLNANGDIIAFSSIFEQDDQFKELVHVFQYINKKWCQLGQEIIIDKNNNQHSNIKLDAKGFHLAVSQVEHFVKIFEFKDNTWLKNASFDNFTATIFGNQIDLSPDGNTISIVSDFIHGKTVHQEIDIYQKTDDKWNRVGQPIKIESFDYSIAKLANNGQKVIVASASNKGGEIKLYEFIMNTWRLKADVIKDETLTVKSVYDLDVNDKGDVFAIGNSNTNQVIIYELPLKKWTKKAEYINSEKDDLTGFKVDLDQSGNQVTVASPYFDNSFKNSGKIEVFTF